MIEIILLIIWIHFISDFLLQTDFIAINKSKNINVLMLHCLIYSIPFLIFGVEYAFINGILHFIVDFITSKLTTYLWGKKKGIGFLLL